MQEYPANYAAMAIRARVGLGRSLKFTGNLDESFQMLGEALDRLHVVQMIRSIWLATMVDVLGDLADVRFHAGALDQAVGYLEQGLAVLGSDAAQTYPHLWRVLMNRLAYVRLRQGDLERAFDLADAATRDADSTEDIQTLANLYSTLGGVRYEQGRLTEAAHYVEHSLDLNQRLNYPWGMANCYTNLGILYYAQGLWQKAVERFSRSDMLRKEIGYVVGQALNLTNLGLLHMALGQHTQARTDFEMSLAISRRLGDDYGIVRANLGMAHLAVTQARYDQANSSIQQAEGLLEAAGEDEAIQVRWLRALILGATGDLPAGIVLAGSALEMARSAGISEQEVESLRVLGHLQRLAGQYEAARQSLSALVDLCAQGDDPYQHGLALLELGLLYATADASDNSIERAQHLLEQAVGHFAHLGASYDLATTQQALALL
jgi:tetratricopeptide (TPR) repeat protein